MYPETMTNDSDRVAPDHRIQLPDPTPVRPRRRIAAGVLSFLLGLSCFAASPTWAYKAGTGANDRPWNLTTYRDVAAYIADAANPNKSKHVQIGSLVYLGTALEALHTAGTLTPSNLPDPVDTDRTLKTVAVGGDANAEAFGAIAIGAPSTALGYNAVAIGSGANTAGRGAVALGWNSRARPHSTALGHASHAQGRLSTAIGHLSHAEGESSIALGHHSRTHALGASSIALGHYSYALHVSSIALGHHSYAGMTSSIAIGQSVRALGKDSIALGRGARTDGMDSIALGRNASATGDKGIAIGSGSGVTAVTAGANEVVVGAPGHTYKLPGLKTTSGTQVVTVDSNGRLSTQTTTTGTTSSRGASLRGAAGLSSDVTAVIRTEAADYEKAPAIGSGPTAPATAEQRRVVVQDTNRDGSVRLRTLDFGDLSGMEQRLTGVDRRVTSLGERLNRATAMSSALSALPNIVPGDNRFFLGVGTGHYSSEQALAIGMSARVQSRVFVNAGVALAGGDEVSVRGGVGVVW